MNAPATGTALAYRKSVQDIVDHRNKALSLYGEAHAGLIAADGAIEQALLAHREASAGESRYNHHLREERLHFHSRLNLEPRKDYMALATRLVDTDCWAHIITLIDLEVLMDKKAKDAFNQQLLENPPEFTFENVMATLETFMADAGTIWRRGIAEAFSKLDRRFRSHDGWKIGSRIILRYVFDSNGYWSYSSSHRDTIMDVERVFRVLDGDRPRYCELNHALEEARRGGWGARQTYVESEYFRLRAWKNGNCHIYFKRDDLLDKVNQLLGEYYGAPIPEDREAEDDPLAQVKTTPAKRYGFFPTPPDAVEQFLREVTFWRERGQAAHRVLEPSAGTGNLARRCLKRPAPEWHGNPDRYTVRPIVECVEIQPALADALRDGGEFAKVYTADFLQLKPETTGLYDRVVMNPPFDRERDIDHVMHALSFLKEGGHLHAIMSAGTEVRSTRKSQAFRDLMNSMGAEWKDMPPASFASVGTYCNTGILTVFKGGSARGWSSPAFRDFDKAHF